MNFIILFVLIFFVSVITRFDISKKYMIVLVSLFSLSVFLVEGFFIKKLDAFYFFLYLLLSFFMLGWDYLIKNHKDKNILEIFKNKVK